MKLVTILTLIIALGTAVSAEAQSTDRMLQECASAAQKFYGEYGRTEMKYNGQRTDGTHAVNGSIFLENRQAYFACSFDRGGDRMTDFFADGERRNQYLPHHESRPGRAASDGYFIVTGVPGNNLLDVHSGPSGGDRIVGALANGDRVRNLGCRTERGARWCKIQMLDDMRSEGWVNARYLDETGASSETGGAIDHGSPIENRCAAAVAREVGVDPDDVIVTNSTISEGTGNHVVYVGVPYGKADWICEADRNGRVVNVFYSGE